MRSRAGPADPVQRLVGGSGRLLIGLRHESERSREKGKRASAPSPKSLIRHEPFLVYGIAKGPQSAKPMHRGASPRSERACLL